MRLYNVYEIQPLYINDIMIYVPGRRPCACVNGQNSHVRVWQVSGFGNIVGLEELDVPLSGTEETVLDGDAPEGEGEAAPDYFMSKEVCATCMEWERLLCQYVARCVGATVYMCICTCALQHKMYCICITHDARRPVCTQRLLHCTLL